MKAKLVKKTTEAKGTVSFFFEPERQTSFLPGQYYYFTLPKLDYPDSRGATRHFTIASSPTESKIFQITTRIREESGYKKTLNALPIGSELEIEGPNGTLILDEKTISQEPKTNHIFLVGGIGITPFRSFIKYNVDRGLKIPMFLIYSNNNAEFVYKKELDQIAKANDYIKIAYFDSSHSGHLDEKRIKDLVPSAYLLSSTWWLVGPPPFIDAMEVALEKLKIESNQIRSEKFTGY